MKILGIDPGLHGGIAIYSRIGDDLAPAESWTIKEMPIVPVKAGRYELDIDALLDIIRTANMPFTIDLAVVEEPPIVPGNGVLAYRSLFKAFGEIRGVLYALDIPIEQVNPKVWKNAILAGTAKDKEAAIHYVHTRYPSIAIPKLGPKSKKYNDGIADSVCLADYGRRLTVGAI